MKTKQSKQKLIEQIKNKLQAPVPGYSSCRPAIIDLRSLNIKMQCNDNGLTEECTIETFMMMGYATVIAPDGTRGWSEHQQFTEHELEIINAAIDLLNLQESDDHYKGKFIRAYNPWWLIGDDCNKVIDKIINETYEEYITSIKKDKKHA